jgi:riboflavin biosynthesis pyrimidine reductase
VTPLRPLALLDEPEGLPAFPLPDTLAALYPGTLGFPDEWLYTNFVQTVDGAVALQDLPRSNRLIADDSRADRFVMALLRACADVVLVGAGTVRAGPTNRWTAEAVFRPLAESFSLLRRELGLAPDPVVAVVTRSGDLAGAEAVLGERLVVLEGPGARYADLRAVLAELRRLGLRRILCEGGPTLFGGLLAEGLVDELFLTVSPLFAGHDTLEPFLALVEGARLLPERRVAAALAGVRRDGDHLFLRYRLSAGP